MAFLVATISCKFRKDISNISFKKKKKVINVFLREESKPIKPSYQLALFCIYLQVECNSCGLLLPFSSENGGSFVKK